MKSGDKIQAYWNKEWWPGIISELPKRKGGKYRVSFSDNSFYDFLPTKLRVNVNKHSSVTKKTRTNANTNTNSVPSVFVNKLSEAKKKTNTNAGPSAYVKARLARIADNKRIMAKLSLSTSRLSSHKTTRKPH